MSDLAHRIAFGERLRDLRQELGWSSQEDFAHHVGLDRTYFSGLERGRRNPTLVIVELAHGLEVTPAPSTEHRAPSTEQSTIFKRPSPMPMDPPRRADRGLVARSTTRIMTAWIRRPL